MRDLLSEHLCLRFTHLLEDPDPRLRLYVYRMHGADKVKPALYNSEPFRTLMDWLRDRHGGGEFAVLIRRGESMAMSGVLHIATPRQWKPSR